jgi:Zn-finger nucleic acid-binding protein
MIGRCDVCNAPISVRTRKGREEYRCHNRGCVAVDKGELERNAELLIVGYLADPQMHKDLAQKDDVQNEELAAVRDKVVEVRSELADLPRRLWQENCRSRSPRRLCRVSFARKSTPEDRERTLTAPSVLRRLIQPGKDAADRWAVATPEVRRATARAVFSPELLVELRVKRSPAPRSRLPVTDRGTRSPGSSLEAVCRELRS